MSKIPKKALLDVNEFVALKADIERFYSNFINFHEVISPDGVKITAATLDVEEPIGTLVILPGRGEIAHKYAELFYSLYLMNIKTAVLFGRGQGQSQRLLADPQKSFIDNFDDARKDVECLLSALGIKDYMLMGFSMGGLIGLDLIKNGRNKPRRAVFNAPYLWPFLSFPKFLFHLAVIAVTLMPFLKYRYVPGGGAYRKVPFADNYHSHCKERYEAYHDYYAKNPDLTMGGATLGLVRAAFIKQRELFGTFELSCPIKIQATGLDKVVSSKAAAHFCSMHRHDKFPPEFSIIDNAYHDLLNESDEYRIESLYSALTFLFEQQ